MALLSCLRCGSLFAVGAERCPQCWSEDFEEADVPKITTWGGASAPAGRGVAAEAVAVPAAVPEAIPVASAPEPAPEPAAKPEPAVKPAKPALSLSDAKDTP